jgi:hypothetical protein
LAGSDVLSPEERERLLATLERDRQFRYALMGLLGYRELLERFSRLEERQQKLEELFAKLEERMVKLEERQQRLEERIARLEERFISLEERQQKLEERFAQLEERVIKLEERIARLEERFAELEKRFQDLEERFLKLEERVTRLEERVARLEEAVASLQRTVITIAHRFGVASEHAFREALKGIVEDLFGAKAERWITYDSEGLVYGHPAEVEVDVVIRDREHLLVEVKSRADSGDVLELARIASLYERRTGVKPRLAIVAGFVSTRAYKIADRLGVRIYTYLEQPLP